MTFLEYINKLNFYGDKIITIGNFDGVHIGHQRLIDLAVELGKKFNMESIAFTYANHPMDYIYNKSIEYLTDDVHREELILERGINRVLSVPFDEELKSMTCREFMEEILVKKLGIRHLVIGADSYLGKGREGSAEGVYKIGKELGIEVHIISLVTIEGLRISSTYIRELIGEGKFEEANLLLGREFSIKGRVIHGRTIGRTMGFPTANIDIAPNLIIPENGVYKTIVEIEDIKYNGATNIGIRPTFKEKTRTVETHILDFNEIIYGKEIKLYFCQKIRDEVKFNSKEKLQQQLKDDINLIRESIIK
ncbi:MAG: bifunctional riboflavin kinase/FAD synthetase [Filifactoraceae bacterium]